MRGRQCGGSILGTIIVASLLCPPLAAATVEEERAAILAMFDARLKAILSAPTPGAMADAYVKDVTEDAWWMPPAALPVRGKEAVRAWVARFFERFILHVDDVKYEPIEVGSTLAVGRFTAAGRYTPRGGGDSVAFLQKYVDVLRKLPDGSWKLSLHMWSSSDASASIWDPHHPLFRASR